MARQYKKVKCDSCDKEMTQTNLKKHQKVCKGKKKEKVIKKKKIAKRDRKGKNFFLTMQKPLKYQIMMKLHGKPHMGSDFQAVIVGNEYGISQRNGHSHALVITKEKMNFKQFKGMWEAYTKIKNMDCESARNVDHVIKYISKEDVKCLHFGIDQDKLSLNCKAYIAAKDGPFNIGRYPYPNLCRAQQVTFKELVEHYHKELNTDMTCWEEFQLYIWQKAAIQELLKQNDREVMWIIDPEGNHGKTVLAKYLIDFHKAIVMSSGKTQDLAHAFSEEKIVVFDYTRDKQDYINYGFIESLKNGMLFSPKYESHTKRFDSVKVLCLSNFEPDLSKLSSDRWVIFDIHVVNHAIVIKRRT